MKTAIRVIGVIVLLVLAFGVFITIRYPFLTPWYHNKYNAEAYQDEVVRLAAISETDTETCIMSRFESLYPYWLGTRWNFNGITETPGEGAIACGYFVTTMVRDMHFDIPRVKLAQCASEEMIISLVDKSKIKRYNGKENELILKFIEDKGRNLYIIGLDNHTGFVLHDGTDVWFIHSSGTFPFCVVKEKIADADVLLDSKYKVLGNLSESPLIWEY
jgi:hypothetical protein